ncbi:MAG: radical SAM protein [Archaeoglobi archaeon]|nr:radical SAM protein [Archaeoglobi archaeon]
MITLINPSCNVETVRRLDFSTPPLGLAYLASALREADFRVKIVDNMVERLSVHELVKRVRNSFMVGITSTTPTFSSALRLAREMKQALPDVHVVLGGVHVSFTPFSALKSGFVDSVCVGEGERTIVEVAERIESGKGLDGVKGIVYRDGERVVFNEGRGHIDDLDSLPFPAYDLLPMDRYRVIGRRLNYFPVITSRGCPFGCIYCSTSRFMGRRFRRRSAGNVVDEIEWLYDEFGARNIAFSDDTFTLDRNRVLEICREIRGRGLDISWSCSSRVDTVDEEMLREMRRAGCEMIYYGVESASEDVLRFYRKRISLDKVRRAVELTKRHGMLAVCSFILGAPIESRSDMMSTIDLALSLDPDYAQFSILTPYPGTEVYELARENGWLLTENFDEYTAGRPVMRGEHVEPEEVMNLLKLAYRRFYLRPSFILRNIRRKNFGVVAGVLRLFLRAKLGKV